MSPLRPCGEQGRRSSLAMTPARRPPPQCLDLGHGASGSPASPRLVTPAPGSAPRPPVPENLATPTTPSFSLFSPMGATAPDSWPMENADATASLQAVLSETDAPDLVRALVAAGADPLAASASDGPNALALALWHGRNESVGVLVTALAAPSLDADADAHAALSGVVHNLLDGDDAFLPPQIEQACGPLLQYVADLQQLLAHLSHAAWCIGTGQAEAGASSLSAAADLGRDALVPLSVGCAVGRLRALAAAQRDPARRRVAAQRAEAARQHAARAAQEGDVLALHTALRAAWACAGEAGTWSEGLRRTLIACAATHVPDIDSDLFSSTAPGGGHAAALIQSMT
jgi:hypothetical protein